MVLIKEHNVGQVLIDWLWLFSSFPSLGGSPLFLRKNRRKFALITTCSSIWRVTRLSITSAVRSSPSTTQQKSFAGSSWKPEGYECQEEAGAWVTFLYALHQLLLQLLSRKNITSIFPGKHDIVQTSFSRNPCPHSYNVTHTYRSALYQPLGIGQYTCSLKLMSLRSSFGYLNNKCFSQAIHTADSCSKYY